MGFLNTPAMGETRIETPPTLSNSANCRAVLNSNNDSPPPFPPGAHDPTVVEPSKLGPWLTAMLVGGLGLTAYGLSDFWNSRTVWPEELRWDLRHALRENAKGDKAQAEFYLGEAWRRAQVIELEKLGRPRPALRHRK